MNDSAGRPRTDNGAALNHAAHRRHPRKDPPINTSTTDNSLFSHPIAEQPRPGALTASQEHRYGSLFLQPVYTPAPATGGDTAPEQRRSGAGSTWAQDPSGRRAHR